MKKDTFLIEMQEECNFVKQRAATMQHSPETVWKKLCMVLMYGMKEL